MAMTASVKDELSRLAITKPCCRKAEVSSLLRFAGGPSYRCGKDSY
jgi:cell division protein WhiA